MYLLTHNGLLGSAEMDFERLINYVTAVQKGYKNVTYHNKTHAADLCQTFNYFCKAGLEEMAALDNTELVALYVAACCHDYEHPGVNNTFLSNIKDPMALRHNDISVLESHHIAASFQLMLSEDRLNWMQKFDVLDYKRLRKLMIDAVFSTDITKHFGDVAQFKSIISLKEFAPSKGPDKHKTLMIMFHMADISNPAKPFELCRLWTDLLFVEFFAQGDLEKQLNFDVSQFMDRDTTNIAKSQIGFIDALILPAFNLIG